MKKKEEELSKIEKKLLIKNKEQENAFKVLQNNNTILKILSHSDELKKYELEYAQVSKELEIVEGNIKLKEKELSIMENINKNALQITNILNSKNILLETIKKNFSEYTSSILFDLRGEIMAYTANGAPSFELSLYSIKSGKVTAESDGNSYNKHIKCCLDLSFVVSYAQLDKKFFKFLFHDASIEASDTRLKKAYLDLVTKLCEKYKIQYITTAINDEIVAPDIYNLLKDNIILKLNDAEDYSGTLFGFRF